MRLKAAAQVVLVDQVGAGYERVGLLGEAGDLLCREESAQHEETVVAIGLPLFGRQTATASNLLDGGHGSLLPRQNTPTVFSDPAIVDKPVQMVMSMRSLTNWTEPSARRALTPIECRLRAVRQP